MFGDVVMSKTLTISIAAYNIEKYIHKLMDSLINAECMEELEILIVDDGSKDETAKLAHEYELAFSGSVKHVAKENGGHGSTINKGIELATGKYFRALDGDDWVNSDNLNNLIKVLKSTDVDLVISDYDKCYSDGRVETIKFNNVEPMREFSFDEIVSQITWMCYHTIIYKTEILKKNHIRLDEKCFYVDTEYDLFPIPYISSVLYYNKPVYCYRLGIEGQSVSPKSRKKNIEHGYTVARSILRLCDSKTKEVSEAKKEYIIFGIADHCIWHIRSLLMFPFSFAMQKKIRDFDGEINHKSIDVFRHMEKHGKDSRIICLLRSTKYYAYWPIKLYKRIKRNE